MRKLNRWEYIWLGLILGLIVLLGILPGCAHRQSGQMVVNRVEARDMQVDLMVYCLTEGDVYLEHLGAYVDCDEMIGSGLHNCLPFMPFGCGSRKGKERQTPRLWSRSFRKLSSN